MSSLPGENPYRLDPESIELPPKRFFGVLRRIGPGLILTSSVVGSGELIATTLLGAENGYTLLWLILLSCTIKIVVQNELGCYTIGTGETTLEAFDRIPGPRLQVSWVNWLWFLVATLSLFSTGGMIGGISEVLHTLFSRISFSQWLWIINIFTVTLLVIGRYSLVERIAVAMVTTFTGLTVACAFLLSKNPQYFSWKSVLQGLSFHRPQGGLMTAVTVFGSTGVGAIELTAYPYWCIEKGYARFTGSWENSSSWRARATGWINVMGTDVLSSWFIYTLATVAFYFLGAGILSGLGLLPKGPDMVRTLSKMFTETLGDWSFYLFLIGSLAVLYSTVFSGIAALSRMLTDFIGMFGFYDRRNYTARLRVIRISAVILPVLPTLLFLFVQEPVFMIKVSGVSQALLLPAIGTSTLYLHYVHLPKDILTKRWLTGGLWVTTLIMTVVMGYSVIHELSGW